MPNRTASIVWIWVGRALLLGFIIVTLELGSASGRIGPLVLPAPHEIVAALGDLITSGQLLTALMTTGSRVLIALCIGTATGITAGVLLWRAPVFARSLEPFISSLYAVPWLLFYPVMLLVFGINDRPIIFLSSIFVFVPVALNTLVGLREIPRIYLRVGRAFRLPPHVVFRRVVIPAIAPNLMLGIELGLIYGFLAIIATEFLISTAGLGFAVSQDYSLFRLESMYAYVLAIIILSFGFSAMRKHALQALRGR